MQEKLITEVADAIAPLVSDYELIIVDNASSDDSVGTLKRLTSESGLPNLQVYALTKEVDLATAAWVGLENALGDYVVVINPLLDDIHFVSNMLEHAVTGADVVFANNEQKPTENLTYQAAFTAFNGIYKYFNGLDLVKEAPQYRVLSKRVVNFILQHPQPGISYRHLPATGGFAKRA